MRSVRVLLVASMALGLPLLAAGTARAELKIGMVDLVAVTNGYARTKDASIDLQTEQAKLKAEAEPKAKALDELRLKRDGFRKGSAEYKRLDDDLLKTEVELRNWLALEQVKIERKHRDVLLDMYREITKVVGDLAKAKALDLVFTTAFLQPPQINVEESTGLEDLKNRIVGQRLLYPSDITDLTKETLDILNKNYEEAKKKAAAAPAPKG